MTLETRRRFVARGIATGIAMRVLRGQTSQPVPIPGLEAGEPTKMLALRNVTVIDATGQPAMPGMTVVIAGNKIQSVSRDAVPAGVPAVDATGKFLIPGLWDMHIHDTNGEINPLFIPNGVLGVRTMGGSVTVAREFLKRREEVATGKRLGPRLVVASPTLNGFVVPNAEAGRRAVRDAVRNGADCLKVYDGLSPESYFAIADEAKKLKVPFVGHAPDPPGLEACAKAGQKSFEHVFWVRRYLQRVTGVDLADLNETNAKRSLFTSQTAALSDVFLRNQAWLCPTLTATFGATGDPSLRGDPRLKYFDDSTRAGWATIYKRPDLAAGRKVHELYLTVVGAMHKAGVGILAGTDTELAPLSNGGPSYCLPGFGLHDELRHMVSAGLSPMDALRTATHNPTKFLGLLDSLGTVETGKLAELVLLDADPLDNIANTTKIHMVFTGGRVFGRPALDGILNAVETNVRNAFKLDPAVLSRYVGDYEFADGSVKWTVKLEEGVLWLGRPNFSLGPLKTISETTFDALGGDRVEFAKNDTGEVTRLFIYGREYRADRKN